MGTAADITDPRVQRTRERLRRSLLELLAEEDYRDITLQDVVERAGVARSTFYNHYDDQDQLLADCFAALSRAEDGGSFLGRGTGLDFVRPLLEHLLEARVLFDPLLAGAAPAELERGFEDDVARALRRVLGPLCSEREPEIRMMAAAFLGLTRWWLSEAPHVPLTEVEGRFRALASVALTKY